jgi:putative membrane protein
MNDSQLANDRTFLAWLRTGIALFGLGFVVAKVAFLIDPGTSGPSDDSLYSSIGVLAVLSGASVVILGFRLHTRYAKTLGLDEQTRTPRWTTSITAAATAGALLLSALIIATT